MVRRGSRKPVDPFQAKKYIRVARALRKSASDLGSLAEEGDRYGNAIAIITIHAGIAYADALSIAYGGFKSTEGDHEKAVDALKDALGHRADHGRVRILRQMIKKKDTASYQGIYYTVGEARKLVAQLDVFGDWVEEMYEQRPS